MSDPEEKLIPFYKLRSFQVAVSVYIIYALVASFTPLLSNFGFEFALLFSALVALFASIGSVAQLFSWVQSKDELGKVEAIVDTGILHLFTRIYLTQFIAIAIPTLLFVSISIIRGTTCNWGAGLAWYGLLVPVTLAYSVAWALVIGSFLKGRRFALFVTVLFVLAGIGMSLFEMASGPHCFAYNPFFGYFPGPIYDRVVLISNGLILFRLSNIATAIFLGCFLSVTLKISLRRGGRTEPRIRAAELLIGFVALCVMLTFSAHRDTLHVTSGERIILQELSGLKKTEHFNIYYPPDGAVAERIDLIAADHEFRYSQITSELNLSFPRTVKSFIYLTDGQKKRLQGAGPTMYADVSNAAIHMSYRDFPHHVLKHELTHVLTAVWGIPYFGWSTQVGLTEGVAVAMEGHRDEFTLHEWAAAMLKLKRLPKMTQIMGPVGFWSRISSRSYIAAGSFSKWLQETDGMEKYHQVYKRGNFDEVYGNDLETLQDAWIDFLETIRVSDRLMMQARHKFNRRSLFEQKCAREVERLVYRGDVHYRKGRYHDAVKKYEEALEFADNNPKVDRRLMRALIGAKQFARAQQVGLALIEKQGGLDVLSPKYTGKLSARPVIRALVELARLHWMVGDLDEAKKSYQVILDADYSQDYSRLAEVALASIGDEEIEPYMRAYLVSDAKPTGRNYYLFDAVAKFPKKPIPRYLLGRRLFFDQEYFSATFHLLEALKSNELSPRLRLETLFVLGQALYMQKRFAEAEGIFNALAAEPVPDGTRMAFEDWLARVRFSRDYFSE